MHACLNAYIEADSVCMSHLIIATLDSLLESLHAPAPFACRFMFWLVYLLPHSV